ncbi:MAG: HAD family hydrolase [Deltaproteobacteria bacterium]|nr:HAD family hydrolase [Deltaproteobacteria bacterium]
MTEPIRAVLFDLDGVLVDTYEAWYGLVRAAARHFGAPDVSRSAFDASWGQSVEDDARELVPGPTTREVADHYESHFGEHVGRVGVDREARAVLSDLRARGIRTACVTNSPTPVAQEILRAADLEPLLDAVVGAGDVPRPKPAPDLLDAALRRLDVPPTAAVMVGDSRFDEQAADAAGVRYVHYDTRARDSLARALEREMGPSGGGGA